MTEERAPYATDEVTQLRRQVAQLVDRLDAAFKTIGGFTDASNFQWAEYQRRIAELEQTVARLEADKRRLIAQIPYEYLRYIVNSHPNLRVDLRIEAKRWLDTVKVPHD